MDAIKRKLKQSIPVIDLFQSYTATVGEIESLDKGNLVKISNDIKSLGKQIAAIKSSNMTTAADAWHMASMLVKYDQVMSSVHDRLVHDINNTIENNSTSISKSQVYMAKVGTMFREIFAMYESYMKEGQAINQLIYDELLGLLSESSEGPIDVSQMDKWLSEYPGGLLLYAHWIQSRLNSTGIPHKDKMLLVGRMNTLKNQLFGGAIKQQKPTKNTVLLQNMCCVPRYRNVTVGGILKMCFGIVNPGATFDVLEAAAKKARVGILLVTHMIKGNHIYDMSNIPGKNNAIKFKKTVGSCVSAHTVQRFNTIIPSRSQIGASQIGASQIGKGRMVSLLSAIDAVKWIYIQQMWPGSYDLMYRWGSAFMHKSVVDRIIRGASVRMQAIGERRCSQLAALITEPTEEDELEIVTGAEHISKLNDKLVAKFIELVGRAKPATYNQFRSLVAHDDMSEVIFDVISNSLVDIADEKDPDVKAELQISALSYMVSIVENFRLSINNRLSRLNINNMVFKERSGSALHNHLVEKVTPIYMDVSTELLSGKTDVFTNIRDKRDKLNITQTITYM